MGVRKEATCIPSLSTKLLHLLRSDAIVPSEEELLRVGSDAAACYVTRPWTSSYNISPWNPKAASPLVESPWTKQLRPDPQVTGLVGSLVRREGHVYSLAAAGDLLYTGSESRNIRVWKGRKELSCFRSSSGFVKAIVVSGDRIFTSHQDGKIRVWRRSSKDPSVHKRVMTLPTLGDFLRSSMIPRHHSSLWLRHLDTISCLSLDEDAGILYSGSWDKTVKVWRISDCKCLESFNAHDDAVNAVAAGFDGLVFTGSADGTVKAWRREVAAGVKDGIGGATRHVSAQTLLQQEAAVTALAVVAAVGTVYCGSSDGVVLYWQREAGGGPLARGGALRGHGMAVLCLAAAGTILASGSADRTIRVWRRDEGGGGHVVVAILVGHAAPIKCVAVEAEEDRCDGRRYVVYSGSLDKSVKIWRVGERERLPEAASADVLAI